MKKIYSCILLVILVMWTNCVEDGITYFDDIKIYAN